MKRFVLSTISLLVVSAGAAFVTYLVVGPPDRSVACDPDDLPEHHVCLATVREWPAEEIFWVDARPREAWQENGVEGSLLVNDQEEWLPMEEAFMEAMMAAMMEAPKRRVVVYCNQSGCGSSKYVAKQLREKFAEALGIEIFVLQGGIKALQEEERGA